MADCIDTRPGPPNLAELGAGGAQAVAYGYPFAPAAPAEPVHATGFMAYAPNCAPPGGALIGGCVPGPIFEFPTPEAATAAQVAGVTAKLDALAARLETIERLMSAEYRAQVFAELKRVLANLEAVPTKV